MSKTKHLNISCFRVYNEQCVFLIGYHKDQDTDAPFEKYLGPQNAASSFLCSFIMQKDLSEWINVSSVKINDKVMDEINKPVTRD
ncbi:hypothetical protein CMO93_03565 [Candidatus Woesearchaeota archaeon]|nr:hypothetical protein [Candidatus Woesearchaeota archaeon]|tara:strand:+ start:3552 stop:3806 length:255 start_codon:yes stop_codon:yes gene_type:complete